MAYRQRRWIAAVLGCLLLAAVAASAVAQDDLSEKSIPRGDEGSGGDGGLYWLQTFGALAIVIALIFLARYLLRKLSRRGGPARRSEIVEVLTRASVTPKHQLTLVRMGRRLLLIGCGPEGLTPLTEITDQQEIDELLQAVQPSGEGSLASLLKRGVTSGRADNDDKEPATAAGELAEKIRSRLASQDSGEDRR